MMEAESMEYSFWYQCLLSVKERADGIFVNVYFGAKALFKGRLHVRLCTLRLSFWCM